MDRRTFLGTLAGGLLAAPLAAQAQPTGDDIMTRRPVIARRGMSHPLEAAPSGSSTHLEER
jgi:hypothetical protein